MVKPGFGKLASLKNAIAILSDNIKVAGQEQVSLDNALGRILGADLVAPIDVPHFQKSAMDGYAILSSDSFGASNTAPKNFKFAGAVLPGEIYARPVASGECVEIATGAPLPGNADAVVMVEYTERTNDHVVIYKPVAPGENVIRIGSDIKKGEPILAQGAYIAAPQIGVLAALGMTQINVFLKPKVAVLTTGTEIIKQGEKLEKGKVYDINSQTLSSAIRENRYDIINLGFVPDDPETIKEKIIEGIGKSDLVLLSGGSSLGSGDLIVEALTELGEILIHGIAVKPGKPTIIARIESKLVIGLPGHPMSCLSDFYILVLPVLRKMSGCRDKVVERRTNAVMTRKVASTIGRYEFLPVKIVQKEEIIYAEPVMKGSSAITNLAYADGFIGIEENVEILEKGEVVEVRLF